jgi:hypothetical protein
MRIVSNTKGRWTCDVTCVDCLTQVELEESDLVRRQADQDNWTFEYTCPICKKVREIAPPKGKTTEQGQSGPTEDSLAERQRERREQEREQERKRKEDRDRRGQQMYQQANPGCTMR